MNTLERIAVALKSPDEDVRLQGLRELAAVEPVAGLDLLFKAFGDDSWRVRKDAIDIFMSLPVSRDLAGEVIELLYAEENAGLRNAAVEILTRLGRTAVPMLLEHAGCADHDVRKFVIDILGDIAAPEAIPVLVRRLEDDDSNVRAAAAENLGKLKAVGAVRALLGALQHPDLLLRFTILDALGRIAAPVPLAELAPYKDEKLLRKALVDCLGRAGDASAASELVTALTDPMRNVREAAVTALVAIGERFPSDVRRCLESCDKVVAAAAVSACLSEDYGLELRRAGVRVLGWLGVDDAVAPLLGLLDNEVLQREAVAALTEIGKGDSRPLRAAWPVSSGDRRACLAFVMGEAGCTDCLPLLHEALLDGASQVVSMAALAVGRVGDAGSLPALLGVLGGDAAEAREAASHALIALGRRAPGETFSALRPLLALSDSDMRVSAVTILRELEHPEVQSVLGLAVKDPAADVRKAALKLFERCDPQEHVGTLLLGLTDEDAEVRRTVVEILANCSGDEAVDGLKLALRDEDLWVRSSAVRGLGRLGGKTALSLVEGALGDPVGLVAIAALETLAVLAGAAAVPQLVAALGSGDADVVMAALNLLRDGDGGDWLMSHAATLLNHPSRLVRVECARFAAARLGADAIPLLEERLAVEPEEGVRQLLTDLLDDLTVH